MVIDILIDYPGLYEKKSSVFKKLESWRLFYYMIGIVIPGFNSNDYPIEYLPSVVTNQPWKKNNDNIL